MDAQQVKDKILADASAEAENIKAEANKKEAQLQAAFDKELAEYNQQTEELAKKEGEEKKSHLLAQARMDIAKEYLAEKRKILDEVFNKTAEMLKNHSDDNYRMLMSNLMLKAVETGDEEVVVDTNENRIDNGFIKEINKQLGNGKGNLKLSADRQNIGCGFILRRGQVNNNASLAVLISEARKALEVELAGDIFAG